MHILTQNSAADHPEVIHGVKCIMSRRLVHICRLEKILSSCKIKMKLHPFTYVILFFALTSGSAFAEIDDVTLIEKLRQGGYVIIVRHAITNHNEQDTGPDNCVTQRNLNSAGRKQAETIGKAIKLLNIPVGEIYSSSYCRCIETAELAFGEPETLLELSSFMREDASEKTRRVDAIRRLLGDSPKPDTNTFLVSHLRLLHRASNIKLSEGEAAMFLPEGNSQFQHIANISAERWKKMLTSITENLPL